MYGLRTKTKPPLVISSEKRKRARLGFDECGSTTSKRRKQESSGRDAAGSPEPNCPICLGMIEGKSYAHGCFHSFCKTCLCEWAKVKAECPVCREPFDKIIYNVTALDVYDEAPVPPRPSATASLFSSMGISGISDFFLTNNWHQMLQMRQRHVAQAAGPVLRSTHRSAGQSFTATTSTTTEYRAPHSLPLVRSSLGSLHIQIDTQSPHSFLVHSHSPHHAPHTNPQFDQVVDDMFRPMLRFTAPRPGTMDFRRHIYRADLWVKFPFPESQRRESSAHFYRTNPAVTFRLHEFIRRDLKVIIHRGFETVHQMIVNALSTDDIRSRSFRRLIENHTLTNTDHFIHELYCFAVSPIELLESYDRRVQYVSRSETRVQTTIPPVPPLGFMYELDELDDDLLEVLETRPTRRRYTSRTTRRPDPVCIDLSSDDEDNEPTVRVPVRNNASATVTSAGAQSPTGTESRRQLLPVRSPALSPDRGVNTPDLSTSPNHEQTNSFGFNMSVNLIDDFDNPTPGPSGINTSIVLPINLTQELEFSSDSDDDIDVGQDRLPDRRRNMRFFNEEEDDADEVEVVATVKARCDRTPELVDLSDDEPEDENQESRALAPMDAMKTEQIEVLSHEEEVHDDDHVSIGSQVLKSEDSESEDGRKSEPDDAHTLSSADDPAVTSQDSQPETEIRTSGGEKEEDAAEEIDVASAEETDEASAE